jgi:SNF2 family DNA or RNA helicase
MRQKMKVWLRCFVLQRTKQQVLPDLPPKTRISVNLKLSPAERKIYQTGLPSILQKLHGDRMNKAAATFVASYRYYLDIGSSRKVAFDTALEEINQRLQTDDVNKALLQMLLRGLVGKVKVPAVIAYIRKLMKKEPGAPMLIFVDQKAVKTRLKAALSQMSWGRTGRKIRVGEIVGGMSRKRSDQTVEDFQNGDYDMLLLSKAATTGITLHRAKIVVFAERFWLPSRRGDRHRSPVAGIC